MSAHDLQALRRDAEGHGLTVDNWDKWGVVIFYRGVRCVATFVPQRGRVVFPGGSEAVVADARGALRAVLREAAGRPGAPRGGAPGWPGRTRRRSRR